MTSRTARRLSFEITDDSGFLAIIDPDAYQGFVHARWNWKTINQHFRQEMRDRHLLFWGTGLENFWNVEVWFSQFKGRGFREIVGRIEASRGCRLLTNYESISLAVGSKKMTLPEAREQGQVVAVFEG